MEIIIALEDISKGVGLDQFQIAISRIIPY